jgi:hypothetical protein
MPRAELAQDKTPDPPVSRYFPPCALLLEQFGVSVKDIQGKGTVTVPRSLLRILLGELAVRGRFDEEWYARKYPDVEGARLAGDIKSLQEHFTTAGYFEGRLSCEPPFDREWYRQYYHDIAEAFPASDSEGMRQHYLTAGFHEGRGGTQECLTELERWIALGKR